MPDIAVIPDDETDVEATATVEEVVEASTNNTTTTSEEQVCHNNSSLIRTVANVVVVVVVTTYSIHARLVRHARLSVINLGNVIPVVASLQLHCLLLLL
jgi:ABC-type proline/glycine betaine transport system permease subunit